MKSINEMIKDAGWFPGTQDDWDSLPYAEMRERAFSATGCLLAYPTWKGTVDCLHVDCRIRRGELSPIEKTSSILEAERHNGWLRFLPEDAYRAIKERFLCRALEMGIYDPWEIPGGWQVMVAAAIFEGVR